MLADGQHLQVADGARVDLVDELRDRRHVAVLEADPHDARMVFGGGQHVVAVGHLGAQRLLDQHVDVSAEHVVEHGLVGHVRRGDDHGVAQARVEELVVMLEHGEAGRIRHRVLGPLLRRRCRVGDRRDLGAVDGFDVGDVLDAHHPGSDDPVTDRSFGWGETVRCHASSIGSGRERSSVRLNG